MKILVDLQGCQTESRHRGIGRYSLALAKGIVRNSGEHHVMLLANGGLANGIADLRAHFAEVVDEDFIVFDVDTPVAEIDPAQQVNCRLAELKRERLIQDIAPDVVLLTSLFEGFLDDAVTSIGTIGARPVTAAVLYDLIPFLNKDPAWPPEYLRHYAGKIESFKKADLLLSISDYARLEARKAIPDLQPHIVNMSSACDPEFFIADVSQERRDALFARYGISSPFIMSAGNIEYRKNFDLLVQAFGNLPAALTHNRQIVIVGSTGDKQTVDRLRATAISAGVARNKLVITGHTPDADLCDLYRLCEIFVFPSLHEGFGLPPLEAMSCGAAVIASNVTSLPEVIGRKEAMFTPTRVDDLKAMLQRAFEDPHFYRSLKEAAPIQAGQFSWDRTALTAIAAMADVVAQQNTIKFEKSVIERRLSLAMVSPLPPEQTGIAEFVAELLPDFSKYYKITIISNQSEVSKGPHGEFFDVKSVDWFEEHADTFDRVVYHMGNSPFHAHMPDLMARYPGIVVLHDFFISNLVAWMELTGYQPDAFKQELLHSHGYRLLELLETRGLDASRWAAPCSYEPVLAALGLILHSAHSKDLISEYYGPQFAEKAMVTKLNRQVAKVVDREVARKRLGIADNCFVVCAFGFMDQTKLNHRLLEAWAQSSLAIDEQCHLIFVGGHAPPEYATLIDDQIATMVCASRISITGFAPRDIFENYLAAADIAVQTRTMSRGETSGTVLDCMAHGLPLIINAHGSMREYSEEVLVRLPDEFSTEQLIEALERLRTDESYRKALSSRGIDYIKTKHTPELTVASYIQKIEEVFTDPEVEQKRLALRRFWSSNYDLSRQQRLPIERQVTNLIEPATRPHLYIDISATARNDLRTGIERFARAILREILMSPPNGYVVKPVYLSEHKGRWRTRCANTFLSQQDGFSLVPPDDYVVTPRKGDVLLTIDMFTEGAIQAEQQGLYAYWRAAGARVAFIVYDLLPITHPHCFPEWSKPMHQAWITAVVRASDRVVSISQHACSELEEWMKGAGIPPQSRPQIGFTHPGADVAASFPTKGLPEDAQKVLAVLEQRPTFVIVGTIEPRKGHLQVIDAFNALWGAGIDANLVVVGHEGWKALPDHERRTIPQIVEALNTSPELGKRLFWLAGISDEYLEAVYKRTTCLIAASEGEGFGLPIVEAASHGVPVLARDIPVFREVGGEQALYYPGETSTGLQDAIDALLLSRANGEIKGKLTREWLSWRESADNIVKLVCDLQS